MAKEAVMVDGFESFVNSEESKTMGIYTNYIKAFESFVNSEECKMKFVS